ncbi:Mannosyl-oligosaccharide glucosidase GCS1 [Folsomia candida]|uniref:mannosyl-oligosaccharide glucosidase n=1 Tax=Folsomia candida TaxID=158441 RepID=A0A226D071_FOLCA|nr:Mannosyl-oligosaccharide glucosidase GCS1 [Folsomia candida]
MGELAELLDYDATRFRYTYEKLTDQDLLDKLHWSPKLGAYTDYGNHSDKVVLKQAPVIPPKSGQRPVQPQEKVRHAVQPPELGFVNMFGYVSLFPLILGILKPDSPTFTATLDKLDNPKLLWTPYGLRSLAANRPCTTSGTRSMTRPTGEAPSGSTSTSSRSKPCMTTRKWAEVGPSWRRRSITSYGRTWSITWSVSTTRRATFGSSTTTRQGKGRVADPSPAGRRSLF